MYFNFYKNANKIITILIMARQIVINVMVQLIFYEQFVMKPKMSNKLM